MTRRQQLEMVLDEKSKIYLGNVTKGNIRTRPNDELYLISRKIELFFVTEL